MKKQFSTIYAVLLFVVLFSHHEAISQTACPQQIGYLPQAPCFITFPAFYIISSQPFNPNGITLDLNGNSGPCNASLGNGLFYHSCNNETPPVYYAMDNDFPICTLATPTGTVTFADGTVCHYTNGLSDDLDECLDFVENCSEPLDNLAKTIVPNLSDCKYWDGPCNTDSKIWRSGAVSLGTTIHPYGYKLAVKGGITTEALQLCLPAWCDYVFEDTFRLRSLPEVEAFIKINKHLPGCTPGKKIAEQEGVALEIETVNQQEKIEEIFLHLIAAQKRLDKLDTRIPHIAPVEKQAQHPAVVMSAPTLIYDASETAAPLAQIECFQISPAKPGVSIGVGGVTITPGGGPFNITWQGGSLNNVVCSSTIKIPNLAAGIYNLSISDASGTIGTCALTISNGTLADCTIFSDPWCKNAVLEKLEEDNVFDPSGCIQWEGDPCSESEGIHRMGNVCIGTTNLRAGYNFGVNGGIVTDKFRIELCNGGWCDYVFDDDYPLPSLYEVDQHIKTHKRLPGTISQNDVTRDGGFEMGSVKIDHQKKIEEAYLHLIMLQQKANQLKKALDSSNN